MILLIIGFILLLIFSITVRTVVFHPFKSIFYAVKDFIEFILHRKWRQCKTGELIAYVGLFGKGKTLSAVHYVVGLYNRYNNKMVFDPFRKHWVKQKIHIISNVDLSIPFERFESLQQIVQAGDRFHKKDMVDDTLTNIIVLGDEFSVQMNSRSFKSNIDPLFLNTLLTCRHHHISIIYDAQRFNHVDALLRQVTSHVITCNKTWRIMIHSKYDAWELENASSPANVKPLARFGWFISNKDFDAYDTLATVGNLAKKCEEGDMLSEQEILALQSNQGSDMEQVSRPSRKWLHRQKKLNKK